MVDKELHWFHHWFNRDYLKLYSHRDPKEALGHVDFLTRSIDLRGDEKILDLGCGMGRHSIELAKKGFEVVGVDLSSYLIKKGQKELENFPNVKAKLIVGDMFHIVDMEPFDVVINMFTSFGYFPDDGENARVFEVVKNQLKPGGKFFLDYLHPFQVIRDLKDFEDKVLDGEKIEISRRIEGDRVIKTIVFSDPERKYQEKVKLYTRDQIEGMLSAYSLKVLDVWNDYEGNPWREDGDRQLFYCVSS